MHRISKHKGVFIGQLMIKWQLPRLNVGSPSIVRRSVATAWFMADYLVILFVIFLAKSITVSTHLPTIRLARRLIDGVRPWCRNIFFDFTRPRIEALTFPGLDRWNEQDECKEEGDDTLHIDWFVRDKQSASQGTFYTGAGPIIRLFIVTQDQSSRCPSRMTCRIQMQDAPSWSCDEILLISWAV